MAPRGQSLPQATTESAREARKSFFCELCQKGYARMNEFEAHEGSYDHQHRKRLKEMRQLTKDPNAAAKARERANEESGLKSINLSLSSAASGQPGKKKPVFKSTLQPHNAALLAGSSESKSSSGLDGGVEADHDDPSGAVANEWFEDRYQPRFVSACDDPRCLICRGAAFVDLEKVVAGRRDVEMGGV